MTTPPPSEQSIWSGKRIAVVIVVAKQRQTSWHMPTFTVFGVHQRKVAHRPGEQSPFGPPRAAQKERRGRQVDDPQKPELAVDCFQS